MKKELLLKEIEIYKNVCQREHYLFDALQEREERISYYQAYDRQRLSAISEEDFVTYIGQLWASNMYGNKKYITDKMIESNGGFSALLSRLTEFLYGAQDIRQRWDTFLRSAKFFGPSIMSELLGYIYPHEYALSNSQVIKALTYLGYTDLPLHNSQYTGKKYIEICDRIKEVGVVLSQNGITCDNLLEVDYFLWEVASHGETPPEAHPTVTLDIRSPFEHDDIKEKIANIGTMLGFKTSTEVTVAAGAKVDAVWSIDIGNMGRVMYVFEVQSKGSIDSLILNLQKAATNKAVQAVVAVSDEEQLQRIKREAAPLRFEMKFWEHGNVSEVFENLSKAFDSINKLALVPNEWNMR